MARGNPGEANPEKVRKGYRSILLRVLGDGEWHDFPQLFYALESKIDPQVASKEAARLKQPPEDIDARLRYGKESVVAGALTGMPVEQQGFRYNRSTRKYRLRPDVDHENSAFVREGARVAFRAIMAAPGMREVFQNLLDGKNASLPGLTMTRVEVNPTQRYWLEFALSPESDDASALPFDDEPTP